MVSMHDNIEELIDLKKISNALQKHSNISFALIYGSSKDGKVNIGSDIDIAVWFDNNYNEDSVVNIIKTIESIYPDVECDLTILNSTTVFLQYEALKGKLLFIQKGKQNNWTDFYSLTCRKYEDRFYWMQKQLQYRGYSWNIKTEKNEV